MSDERIDSFIDREGVRRDQAEMLDALNSVYDGFKRIEGIKLDFKGLSGLSTIAPGMQQARTASDALAEATATVQQRIAQLNGSSKEFTQVLLTQVKAEKEAAQAHLLEAKAATENAKAKAAAAKAGQDATKQAAVEKKVAEDLTNDYLQLSKAYNDAALRAKNYALQLGENHPITVAAVADAKAMYDVLLRVDQAVGQSQRNVGNYKSAFDGLRVSFAQVSRELPSLTISAQQFFLAISNNLPMVADEIAKARVEIAALRAAGEPAPSLFSRITSSLLSWQVGLSIGITLLTAFGSKIVSAVAGLFDFSGNAEKAEKYTKDFNDELERSKKALDNYGAALASANQLGALNITIGLGTDARAGLVDLREQNVILQQTSVDLQNLKNQAVAKGIDLQEQYYQKGLLDEKTYNDLSNKNAELQQQIEQKQIETRQNRALIEAQIRLQKQKIAKEDLDKSKENADKLSAIEERRRKAEYEISKAELETEAEKNQAIYKDETQTHAARIEALSKYTEAKKGLIDLDANYEKGKKGILAEEIVAIDKQKNKKIEAQARETASELEKINKEIFGYVEKSTAEQEEVYDKFYKDLTARYKQFLEQKKKLDADDKKREEEEANLRRKLEEDIIKSSINLTKTLLEANLERRKNAIQDQINALDAQKQKDIEVANQTITNAQDRAAAITVIEARAAAQKEALQKKQRDLDIKKAEFEKAAAIASIIQQTAQNLVKAFPNPALIALASALGAVQLATVIAQPIPRYKTGKNVHDDYEGPAIVGDGGKREAIISEDGTVRITGSTPEITHVKRNDIILPDASKLLGYQLARSSADMGGVVPQYSRDTTALEIRDMKTAVVGAIKKIPQPVTKVANVIERRIKYGDTTNTYLNSNLQG